MRKKIVKVRINRDLWKVMFGNAGKTDGIPNDGICDYEKRTIFINKNCERSLLNVLCHELLHARFPDIEEDSVEDMGTLLAETYEQMQQIY